MTDMDQEFSFIFPLDFYFDCNKNKGEGEEEREKTGIKKKKYDLYEHLLQSKTSFYFMEGQRITYNKI